MQENERKEQQAQDISEEMISQENISWEIGEEGAGRRHTGAGIAQHHLYPEVHGYF